MIKNLCITMSTLHLLLLLLLLLTLTTLPTPSAATFSTPPPPLPTENYTPYTPTLPLTTTTPTFPTPTLPIITTTTSKFPTITPPVTTTSTPTFPTTTPPITTTPTTSTFQPPTPPTTTLPTTIPVPPFTPTPTTTPTIPTTLPPFTPTTTTTPTIPTPPTTTFPTTLPPFTTTTATPTTTTTTTIPAPALPTTTPTTPTLTIPTPPPTLISTILNTLGYTHLSIASLQANLTTTTIPITIFAPSDASLLTCPTCSLPLLLQEHTLPGLYPLRYLQSLFFGTKIETLSPNKCLTITSTTTPSLPKKIFINGIEITKPELFNDGFLIIHGLEGFVSHLSPFSCSIEKMTTLSFPPQHASTLVPYSSHIPLSMLNDVITKLRVSGYSIVALALRERYSELSGLNGLTIFALDDNAIFAGKIGHRYVADIGYHIVPNEVLAGEDLVALEAFAVLPTTKRGESLVVTTASGGGPMVPMRINYIKIKNFDLVHDDRVVVHGLSMPFPHVEDQRKSEL